MSETKDRLACVIWMALKPGQRDEQDWHRLPLGGMGEKSLMMSVVDKALEAMRQPQPPAAETERGMRVPGGAHGAVPK